MNLLKVKSSRPFFSAVYRSFLFQRSGLVWSFLTALMLPWSLFYLLLVEGRRLFSRPEKYKFKVVSVGNLTAGGTGKTTLVHLMAKVLTDSGRKVVVAGSGFGSSGSILWAEGQKIVDPESFGDEMVMLARKLPRVVFIKGKGKKNLLKLVAAEMHPDVVLLDDGMQCYGIRKDLEVALVVARNPFDNGFLLPAGLLREPCRRLRRVDAIVITNAFEISSEKRCRLLERLLRYGKPVFFMNYRIIDFVDYSGNIYTGRDITGKRVLAFAGIGQPLCFFSLIENFSPGCLFPVVFPDHFRYRFQDVEEIGYLGKKLGVEWYLMTEKDAVKVWRLKEEKNFLAGRVSVSFEDQRGNKIGVDRVLTSVID